jgi:hypothetical protein
MTHTQLIDDLKLPKDQIERIKALKAGFEEFELIVRGANQEACPPNALHDGIKKHVDNCVNLIAEILNQDPNTVLQALLALFGLTEDLYKTTSKTTLQIVALSALVEDAQR